MAAVESSYDDILTAPDVLVGCYLLSSRISPSGRVNENFRRTSKQPTSSVGLHDAVPIPSLVLFMHRHARTAFSTLILAP